MRCWKRGGWGGRERGNECDSLETPSISRLVTTLFYTPANTPLATTTVYTKCNTPAAAAAKPRRNYTSIDIDVYISF